ncbi:MAG: NADH-quinone oxidoreductase subunit A [Planctomycetaceae bacterium]
MTDLVSHIVLLIVAGIGMALVPLVIGRLVRPTLPTAEKDAIYECGEPTIGSSYIQFDLRYYTVALLFIIFDVEVAFFYPWASVYGGAMQLADNRLSPEARTQISEKLLNITPGTLDASQAITPDTAMRLGMMGVVDIAVFFAVLLVGFAYVWKRGDLDWVRAYQKPGPVEETVS